MSFSILFIVKEAPKEKTALKKALRTFPPPATEILINYERRGLGIMMKMKKINVLNYQVTRFARNNNVSN